VTLKIGFAPWGETIDELVEASRGAEAAGADVIWVSELHRSATVVAAAIAQATTQAKVATGVALAFVRSPMTMALEALDLAELSGGRFLLGLGSGTRRVNVEWHHREFEPPAPRLAEVIKALRAFWKDAPNGAIEVEGAFEPVKIAGYRRPYPMTLPIPVYVAAVGPAMTRLAGRHGNGWLAHELCTPRFVVERVLPELAAGWGETGKPAGYDVTASLCCSVAAEPTIARERVAGHVGFYATVRTYAEFFDFHGYAEEHAAIVEQFRETRIVSAASDGMTDLLTAAGDAESVIARIREYDGVADSVKLSLPVNGLSNDGIRDAQRNLIDLIGTLKS
jgi:alkanesulfonate monooxygenase SsuD/methylene tetrahydromethanopterin reductase-like flavin-dependent oxidoreductase (luciferase family)